MAYLNQKGKTYHIILPLAERRYIIKSIVGSMIILSLTTKCSYCNNYFVINPFTKTFTYIGSIWVGEMGSFSLLENVSSWRYGWVVVKHFYLTMQSMFYTCSSLDTVWMRKIITYGSLPSPRDVVFCKSKMYWLYLDIDYDECPKYGYTIYSLDILNNQWEFTFVPINDIRCMALASYNNQFLCIINIDSTSILCIEELENF